MRVRERLRALLLRGAGQDLSRRNGVHEHAAACVIDGELVRHVHEAALAHGVREVAGRPDHPVLRRDDDHAATCLTDWLLLHHLADRAPAAEEDTAQIDRHDRVPVLVGGLQQRLRVLARNAGVAHHHVEAPVAIDRGPNELVDVFRTRDVGVDVEAAFAEQCCGRLPAFARLTRDIADDDVRPLVREPECNRPADPRTAPGHDRDPLLEAHGPILRRRVGRPPSVAG